MGGKSGRGELKIEGGPKKGGQGNVGCTRPRTLGGGARNCALGRRKGLGTKKKKNLFEVFQKRARFTRKTEVLREIERVDSLEEKALGKESAHEKQNVSFAKREQGQCQA